MTAAPEPNGSIPKRRRGGGGNTAVQLLACSRCSSHAKLLLSHDRTGGLPSALLRPARGPARSGRLRALRRPLTSLPCRSARDTSHKNHRERNNERDWNDRLAYPVKRFASLWARIHPYVRWRIASRVVGGL